jgi:hypothetical protein
MTPRQLTVEEFYEEALTKFRALWEDAKNPIALHEAVRCCQTGGMPLPHWAAVAVLNIIVQHHHLAKGNAGRGGGVAEALLMNLAHYQRWNALRLVLRIYGLKELPKGRGRPAPGELTAKGLLAKAEGSLAGKAHKPASQREIGRSFNLVQKSLAAGEARFTLENLLI